MVEQNGARTILVVDDSRTARLVARKALEKAGYLVVEADNGYEALEVLRARDVDAVLLDWNMPEMGGLETVGHVRDIEAHRATPIIMVTSEHDERKESFAHSAGVSAWVTKPYDPSGLLQVLSTLLD
jgi:two-component system chemotaxis response regulator CheY